jgi:glycosyltransferase involved in cell wall biosynthesis
MLSHGYPPTVSGVTLVVQKLSRALVGQGHAVRVVTASDRREPYRTEDRGVQLERLRSFWNPFWSEGPIPWTTPKLLKKIIDDFQPDVIHTHENAILSYQLLQLARETSLPRVSSCYYLPLYATHYLNWGKFVKTGIENTLWKYAVHNLNQFDHVVFSTQTQEQDFIRHGLSVPSSAISNGVDTQRYYPSNGQAEQVEQRYALPPRPRILFVGRLMKDKKIDQLIQSMQLVCAEIDAHLLVIGRGDEQSNLEKLAQKLGLEAHIHLLGYVPESDLPAIYRASDLFAIASVCEVQSIPALQAAATGLPLVAVDAAALPELVHPGRNGCLVKADDIHAFGTAILSILTDASLAFDWGQASLKIAKRHSEVETFRAYETFYTQVIK